MHSAWVTFFLNTLYYIRVYACALLKSRLLKWAKLNV
jgi:hypothetical protein